jgi:replicative DNA helicase
MSIGNNLLLTLIKENKPEMLLEIDQEYLNKDFEIPPYNFTLNYLKDNGKLPPIGLVMNRFKLAIPEGVSQFWENEFSKVRLGLIYERSSKAITEVIYKGDVGKIKEEVMKLANTIVGIDKGNNSVSRSDALALVKDIITERRRTSGLIGIPTGWQCLNDITGGFIKKNVYVLAARLKMGKTMAMAYMAEKAYNEGHNVLFISMEMTKEEFFTRVLSLMSRISAHALFKGRISTMAEPHLADLLSKDKENANKYTFEEGFFRSSINDIGVRIALEKPDIVFIDGAYLLKLPGSGRMPIWEKATEVVAQLKTLAGKHNVPVVASYQFNREAAKKLTAGPENIHHSDAIAQVATVAIGMFDDPSRPDRKKLEVLANRNGPCGHTIIRWDWNRVDFSEEEGFDESSLYSNDHLNEGGDGE